MLKKKLKKEKKRKKEKPTVVKAPAIEEVKNLIVVNINYKFTSSHLFT